MLSEINTLLMEFKCLYSPITQVITSVYIKAYRKLADILSRPKYTCAFEVTGLNWLRIADMPLNIVTPFPSCPIGCYVFI